MLQGCELGSKRRARAEPVFRSLGNDGDRGGVLGGSALLGGRARFALGRGERRFDLVNARGESGKIRAGVVRRWRPGLELRDSRGEVRNFGARGVDLGFCVRNLLRQALGSLGCGGDTGSVLGVCRFERAHALVEFRAAGRRGARLQRAHAFVEARDGAALAFGFGVHRGAPALRLRLKRSQPVPALCEIGFRGQEIIAGAGGKRANDQPRESASRESTSANADRLCGRRRRSLSRRFGRSRRRPDFVGATPSNFAFDDAGVRPSVAVDRRACGFGRNVLGFLVDHRLASSIFRGLIYGRPQGKETR